MLNLAPNAQLPKYVSCRMDPETLYSDALIMSQALLKGLCFPANIISAVLHKVTWDKRHISSTPLASPAMVATLQFSGRATSRQ